MTSLYEAATSGLNYDRFVMGSGGASGGLADELFNESALLRMKQHFWTAKQLFRSKLGKKEDQHLLASDAELDTKLTRYASVYDTTRRLLAAIEDYHHFSEEIVDAERDLAEFLRAEAAGERPHLERAMRVAAGCMAATARQRRRTLRPLVQLYRDLDVFNERAVTDCQATVEAAERARTEYRGSLLWIKSASEELDPARSGQMEKFRTAQAVVRQKKEKFDALKSDTLRKVDVLAHSRTVLLEDLARELFETVREFYARTAKTFEEIAAQLDGIDSYEIDVLKILNDPVGLALKRQKEGAKNDKKTAEGSRESSRRRAHRRKTDDDEGEVELEEIEVGQIVTDIPRLQPAPPGRRATKSSQHEAPALIQLDDDVGAPPVAVSGTSDASPSILRVESPLGIIDQDRLEWERSIADEDNRLSEFPTGPTMSATVDGDDSSVMAAIGGTVSRDLISLLDDNEAAAGTSIEMTPVPRLQPPPASRLSASPAHKPPTTGVLDEWDFSTIDLNDSQSSKAQANRTTAPPPASSPSKNLSSFLADELQMALSLSAPGRNSSQRM